MKIMTLLAAIPLATPVLAAERLTDAQLDRITAGGFAIADSAGAFGVAARPGPANVGIFVNNAGQAGTLIDRLSIALATAGFTIVDTPGRLGVTAGQAPANIAIFVNDSGQARTPGFVTSRFTIVDTSGRLGADPGFFVTDTGTLFGSPGIPPIVPQGRIAISVR